MKKIQTLFLVSFIVLLSIATFAQSPQLLKRTITKTDKFDFGAGGTVAITGAPNGSIRIVGTDKNEIEIVAQIELQAPTEADITGLALVTGFATDEMTGRTGIISFGTYNKLGDKKLWKKFPKRLMDLPMRIDYVINVPHYCDLEIDGGKGDLSVSGVEGSMRINFLETNADIAVISGATNINVAMGKVNVALGSNGWRGRAAEIMVAKGDLNVKLPTTMSAEIDATILRAGAIENTFPNLKPRNRKVPFTDKSIVAKAGVGGASLKFTVGDGNMKLETLAQPL